MPETQPHVFRYQSTFDCPVETLWAWASRPGSFERLALPGQELRVLERKGGLENGATMRFTLHLGPAPVTWVSRLKDCIPLKQFVDEQVEGPFSSWEHTHRVAPDGEERCTMEDEVHYRLPGGRAGELVAAHYTEEYLKRLFAFRQARIRDDLGRHRRYSERGPMRLAITGSSGLIGRPLSTFLSAGGHEVLRLVRGKAEAGELHWDPAAQTIDGGPLEDLDAIIHLAGENVGAGRWSEDRKKAIMDSRVMGTKLLARTLPNLKHPPKAWISASAVGFYGNRADADLDENATRGEGFLAEVCRAWEAETQPATEAGIRVVNTRFGTVLSAEGGALGKLILPFRVGLGGPTGDGKAWWPWIALEDALGAVLHCIVTDRLSGPVNVVAPETVRNADFAHALGKVMHRPSVIPTPASALRLAFGDMVDEALLASMRVLPRKLQDSGFKWLHPELEDALRTEMGYMSN
jgi:uncharacterized protein